MSYLVISFFIFFSLIPLVLELSRLILISFLSFALELNRSLFLSLKFITLLPVVLISEISNFANSDWFITLKPQPEIKKIREMFDAQIDKDQIKQLKK